jgi:DNA-3-methyladenine glycosylase I
MRTGKSTMNKRCVWVGDSALQQAYHDTEWGVPVYDDNKLFEFLILEGAQAGLSWSTVLKKRDHYRKVFDGFDACKLARYGDRKIESLLNDPGIIRNRAKVIAAIGNARCFLEVQDRFSGFANYIWRFVDGSPRTNSWRRHKDIPVTTPESDAMSKDLKQRGFKFVGSTICYAYMQAVGLVNDHTVDCYRHHEIEMLTRASSASINRPAGSAPRK